MRMRIDGLQTTKARFRQYVSANPAATEGWVEPLNDSDYQVTADYVDPFKEIAANFGLTVDPNLSDVE